MLSRNFQAVSITVARHVNRGVCDGGQKGTRGIFVICDFRTLGPVNQPLLGVSPLLRLQQSIYRHNILAHKAVEFACREEMSNSIYTFTVYFINRKNRLNLKFHRSPNE